MTRFCMQCDRIIGEKCVKCGTEATGNSNAVTDSQFDCPSCGYSFAQGDGGETGGLCMPCLETELQKAYVAAAKDVGLNWRPENRRANGTDRFQFIVQLEKAENLREQTSTNVFRPVAPYPLPC